MTTSANSGKFPSAVGAPEGDGVPPSGDALEALEEAVWARAGGGDPMLHQRLQQALASLREQRASRPATPGLVQRVLRNPVAVLTPLLALLGVAWQQVSTTTELAQQEAQAKRQIRLSLIEAFVTAEDMNQRLTVLETSRVMPSVMGPCTESSRGWTLASLLGHRQADCDARARTAEWVTRQSEQLARLQQQGEQVLAGLETPEPEPTTPAEPTTPPPTEDASAGQQGEPAPRPTTKRRTKAGIVDARASSYERELQRRRSESLVADSWD